MKRPMRTQSLKQVSTAINKAAAVAARPSLARWMSRIMHWARSDAGMQDFSGKRRLICNASDASRLLLPFVCWGVVLIIIYSMSQQSLSGASGPLSMLNLVNFVSFDVLRTVYAAQVGAHAT